MDAAFIDDIRQAYVISENEIKKYLRGKKLLIFGMLILAVTVLLTVLPYAFGGQYNASTDVEYTFTTTSPSYSNWPWYCSPPPPSYRNSRTAPHWFSSRNR